MTVKLLPPNRRKHSIGRFCTDKSILVGAEFLFFLEREGTERLSSDGLIKIKKVVSVLLNTSQTQKTRKFCIVFGYLLI